MADISIIRNKKRYRPKYPLSNQTQHGTEAAYLELDPACEVLALAHGDVVVVLLLISVHHLAAAVALAEGAPLKHGTRLD